MADMQPSDHDLLIRIDAKLDAWSGVQKDHETRIRRVEKFLWIAAGLATAGGAGLSRLADLLG